MKQMTVLFWFLVLWEEVLDMELFQSKEGKVHRLKSVGEGDKEGAGSTLYIPKMNGSQKYYLYKVYIQRENE